MDGWMDGWMDVVMFKEVMRHGGMWHDKVPRAIRDDECAIQHHQQPLHIFKTERQESASGRSHNTQQRRSSSLHIAHLFSSFVCTSHTLKQAPARDRPLRLPHRPLDRARLAQRVRKRYQHVHDRAVAHLGGRVVAQLPEGRLERLSPERDFGHGDLPRCVLGGGDDALLQGGRQADKKDAQDPAESTAHLTLDDVLEFVEDADGGAVLGDGVLGATDCGKEG